MLSRRSKPLRLSYMLETKENFKGRLFSESLPWVFAKESWLDADT